MRPHPAAARPARRPALVAFVLLSLGAPGLAERPSDQSTPAARAPAPVRTLLDRTLRETTARVVRIDRTGVWFTVPGEPPAQAPRVRPLTELVAMVSAEHVRGPRLDDADERPLLTVTLADGQRLIGRVAREPEGTTPDSASSKDAPLTLDTALGTVRIALDVVAGVTVSGSSGVSVGVSPSLGGEAPKKDVVLLRNDDRMEGFVEAIGATVVVQPEGAASANVPLERIREITLANPRTAPRGAIAWLADGSVIRITDLAQAVDAPATATVPILGKDSPTPLPGVVSIAFDASRLTPLARLVPTQVRPSLDRRWTRSPRPLPGPAVLDAPDLELPGPMSVEWDLPERAVRLAGEAELSRFTDNWGDCTISIELSSGAAPRRLWTQRLSGSGASARFNIDLGAPAPGRHLRLVLESGSRGPIQDRVILRRPLLLLEGAR